MDRQGLIDSSLELIHLHAIEELGYSSQSLAAWIEGYAGRYAGVWEEGQVQSISLWRIDSLHAEISPVPIDGKGRVRLYGRRGTGCWRAGLLAIYDRLEMR